MSRPTVTPEMREKIVAFNRARARRTEAESAALADRIIRKAQHAQDVRKARTHAIACLRVLVAFHKSVAGGPDEVAWANAERAINALKGLERE